MGAGCKPAGLCLRWFESNTLHSVFISVLWAPQPTKGLPREPILDWLGFGFDGFSDFFWGRRLSGLDGFSGLFGLISVGWVTG
jgi:hypothetical protein